MQSSTSPADIEAAYRFTRNKAINAQAIAESGFLATAKRVNEYDCLLALEDTTSLEFKYRTVRDDMGHTTSNKHSRGMHAHSVLLFASEQQHVVGLIEQKRWTRDIVLYGQNNRHASRAYESKESYKWEQALEDAFNKAINKGLVGKEGQSGIKKIHSKIYTHEVKFKNSEFGDVRIFGRKLDDGTYEWLKIGNHKVL